MSKPLRQTFSTAEEVEVFFSLNPVCFNKEKTCFPKANIQQISLPARRRVLRTRLSHHVDVRGVQSTLLTMDTAYCGQLSTVDSQQCTLHFGAKTLLTVDNSLNCGPWTPFHGTKMHFLSLPWTVHNFFFYFSFLHFIFSYFYNFKVILVRSIFSFISLYHLKLLERVSN